MPRINQTQQVSQELETNVEIHNITILDRSGSMGVTKWEAAKKGVQMDYENCKKERFKSYTFIQFDNSGHDIVQVLNFNNDEPVFLNPRGLTALYDAVGNALVRAFRELTGKVLVKIFTDGGENDSEKFTASQIKALIKEAESKGYTVTFVGTEHDVEVIQNTLHIDATNTITHDNTGEGVQDVFKSYAQATSEYTKSVRLGEDVTHGFFKSIK